MLRKDVSDPAARPRLDREAIVQAALALLDQTGLDGLSTRGLAAALGVKGPSLYWHFRSMAELKDAMADALLADALPPSNAPISKDSWRSWLAAGARGIRRAALSRRDGARLIAGAQPSARRQARFPTNIARLEAEGFGREEARAAFIALSRYALGSALGEQASGRPASDEVFEFGLQALLEGLSVRRSGAGLHSHQ